MKVRVLALLLTCCPAGWGAQQEEKNGDEKQSPWFLRFAYQPGVVTSTSSFFDGENAAGEPIDRVQAFKIELGWQTDGTEDWEQRYNFPAMGVGLYKASFRNGEELGSPLAIYGWLSWPFVDFTDRFGLTTEVGFGFATNWNPLDVETNPFNDAVSTPVTYYGESGIFARYALNRKLDLSAGGLFTHMSNGATGDPNAAINTLSSLVRLRYNFHRERPPRVRRKLPPFGPYWELSTFGGAGWKNVDLGERGDPEERRNFGVVAVSLDVQRRFYSMGRIGGGVDWSYEGWARAFASSAEAVSASDKVAIGIYGGYEHVVHRFSIPIQIGYYVWRGGDEDRGPALYQKLGWKFHVTDRFFVGMEVRFFDFTKASFVRWNVGYDLKRVFSVGEEKR